MKEKIHIIVPFISLNDYVLECIENILQLNYNNFKLILLPDDQISLPNSLKDKPIKVVVTGKKTIAAKRNLGLKTFPDADYFAFIDSDAYPHKDWLRNALPHFHHNSAIWAVGGPNITPPGEPSRKRVVGNASKSILISGTYRFRKRIAKSRFCNNLPTCNLIVSREALAALSGFNENLITGEDIDLCSRIIQKNKKIFYAKEVIVYHHNRALLTPFVKQRLTWGLSVFKVMNENPSFSNVFLFVPAFFILSLLIISAAAFFNRFFLFTLVFILSIYLVGIILETIRWSEKIVEIPGTFIALLTGNLAPGVGSIWAIFRLKKDDLVLARKIYRNF